MPEILLLTDASLPQRQGRFDVTVEDGRAVVVDGEISDAFSLGTPAAKEHALEELTPKIEEALDDQ